MKVIIIPELQKGPAALLDVFKQASSDWIWPYYQKQMATGVSGWWYNDKNAFQKPRDMLLAAGYAESLQNLYGLKWTQMLYEKHKRIYPEQRFFQLSGSGFCRHAEVCHLSTFR